MPSYLVTLTTKATPHQLSDLIAAINPSERTSFMEIRLEAAQGNTEVILGGDSAVSATRYGYTLTKNGEPRLFSSVASCRTTVGKYLYCDGTDGQQVAVDLEVI